MQNGEEEEEEEDEEKAEGVTETEMAARYYTCIVHSIYKLLRYYNNNGNDNRPSAYSVILI